MKRYVCMMLVLIVFVFSTACASNANAEDAETTNETVATTVTEAPANAEEPEATAEESVEASAEATDRIDYLVLVNAENKIPDDWEEKLTLGTTTDIEGNEVQLEAETLEQYLKMRQWLLDEKDWDIEILYRGAYVSVEDQEGLYQRYAEGEGEESAKEHVVAPGYLENHTGLVIDIGFIRKGQIVSDKDFLLTCNLYKKVYAVMADYGFILRYPEGKEDITGHSFEPWHIRYVGSPEVAHEITDQGITLEEYLAR